MTISNITISVIIPTHNRCASLEQLLKALALQSFPINLMEVIVVADNCKDATVQMLQNYSAPYTLRYIEEYGGGAAVARNSGAALAKGTILLFLDDDIDPSKGMVAAHVSAQNKPKKVVLGYLPIPLPKTKKWYYIHLRYWWEEKYFRMNNPCYRYTYRDLLSGNFSISLELFQQINGFDTAFSVREDYELGARLMKSNAEFEFSKEAWGYHRDEVTNIDRLIIRKVHEGSADVEVLRRHPALIPKSDMGFLIKPYSVKKRIFLFFVFNVPVVTDALAHNARHLLALFEWMRLRVRWKTLVIKLYQYWYLKGVIKIVKSQKNLEELLDLQEAGTDEEESALEIDLQKGLQEAEEKLDKYRPSKVYFHYGPHCIGDILPKPGAERLRGRHLREILATIFAWPMVEAISIEKLQTSLEIKQTEKSKC